MITRRQFLRGDLAGRKSPLRPPWALDEPAFLTACTRCGACIPACPQQILSLVRCYPEIDFSRAECTFCGKCRESCAPHALRQTTGMPPWQLRATIANHCLAYRDVVCRSCGEACGEAAIRFSPRLGGAALPEISNERCTGCGACVAVCPAGAVTMASTGQNPAK